MSSASEILALHKKILPAKYDKKRQPNIIGTDELPFQICITQNIALTLHSPEENILTFPDFFPSSSELTYTVL